MVVGVYALYRVVHAAVVFLPRVGFDETNLRAAFKIGTPKAPVKRALRRKTVILDGMAVLARRILTKAAARNTQIEARQVRWPI